MSNSTRLKTYLETITEAIHYPSDDMVYQKDSKFNRVSIANIHRMDVLKEDHNYLFVVKGVHGCVFDKADLENPDSAGVLPVLVLLLRQVNGVPYSQAHGLRIRASHAGFNLAQAWYLAYIDKVEPIASDKDHLEGGYRLWKGFIRLATSDNSLKVMAWDTTTNKLIIPNITTDTDETELWSTYTRGEKEKSNAKAHVVMLFGKVSDLVNVGERPH